MHSLDRNIFELQPLEIRRLLATAQIDAGSILQISGLANPTTLTVNKISNGKITVTANGVALNVLNSSGSSLGTQIAPTSFSRINIVGSIGADNLSISSNFSYTAATVNGADGNDTITTGTGNDSLVGGNNNDRLDGGGGNDTMAGNSGMDITNYSTRTGALRISLDNASNDGESNEFDNVQTEEVWGGSGSDTFTGSNADDFFYGNGGGDSITGNGGNDDLTGGAQLDRVFGNDGDDYIAVQNNDADTISGGTNSNGTADLDIAEIDGIDNATSVAPQAGAGSSTSATNGKVTPSRDRGPGLSGPSDVIGNVIPAAGDPSDLDPSYGSGGRVIGPDLGWTPTASAVDSQGRVVFVGTVNRDNGNGYGDDFVVARYKAGGALDTDFGTGGQAFIDFTTAVGNGYGNEDDEARGIIIAPGDKIIVLGANFEDFDTLSDSAVARLTDTGAPDASFGNGGRGVYDIGGGSGDEAIDAAVQNDGNIAVLGTVGDPAYTGYVMRLSDTGVQDQAFNNESGDNRFSDFSFEKASGIALQTLSQDNGAQRIVVGWNSNGSFAVTRLLPDGTTDETGFGTDGTTKEDVSGGNLQSNLRDLAVDANNDIIAVGDAGNFSFATNAAPPPAPNTQHAVIAKYAALNGAPVNSAAIDATNGLSSFGAVTVDSSGRYVAVGFADDDFLVARFTAAVQPDSSFNAGGYVETDFSGLSDEAFGTRVVAGGRIIAAGTADQPNESVVPAIARYLGVASQGQTPPGSTDNAEEFEEFINYQDLHDEPRPPEVQAALDRVTKDSQFIILSQPDDTGTARLPLDNGNNTIVISMVKGGKDPKPAKDGDKKLVAVNVDGLQQTYDPDTTTRIEIYGNGGNDTFTVIGDVKVDLLLDGGAGNDIINGGHGDDVLLGGANNDVIDGREGKDIIIGGTGSDNLVGRQEEDILIAGTTSWDNNGVALDKISDEWASKDHFNDRVNFIRNGGGINGLFVLKTGVGATVFDDGVFDLLNASGAKDWIFAHTSGANQDQVVGLGGGDILDTI
jgi:uncharacterized delta-60 repeat protein